MVLFMMIAALAGPDTRRRGAGCRHPSQQSAHAGRRGLAARLRGLPDEGAADSDEPAQGQRALHRLSFARRRQCVSGAAGAGEHDVHRRAVAPQLRARARDWSYRASRSRASCSPIRSLKRPAAATGTAAASTGSRRTTRSGRRWRVGAHARRAQRRAPRRRRSSKPRLELRGVQGPRAADSDESAQGQRALHRVPFAGRRQLVPGAAGAGQHDLHRRAVAAQLRARVATGGTGRAAQERAAHQSARRRGRRQPLARRRQALAVAGQRRVADAGRLGSGN